MSAEDSSELSVAKESILSGHVQMDCRPLSTLTTDLEPHLSLPQMSCESLLPRPDKPSSTKQPLLPSEQFSSEENLLKLVKRWHRNTAILCHKTCWSPVTHDYSIITSQSLLSKLGQLIKRSIHQVQLLHGLLWHMRETTSGCPNFLNKQDSHFCHLHGTLDALFHKLHSQRHRCTSEAHGGYQESRRQAVG